MNIRAVLSHKFQIILADLGPAKFLSYGQPGLVGQSFRIKENAVHVEDNALESKLTHTLPMSLRMCISWKEMGAQAA